MIDTGDWTSYWYLWKAKSNNGASPSPSMRGSAYKDFWVQWKTSKQSGNWSVFEELVAEFAAIPKEERYRRLHRKFRHQYWNGKFWSLVDIFDEPEAEEESEPEEEPQQEKRYGDPGFWEDFGRQYREAEDREQGQPKRPQPRPTVDGHYVTLGVTPDATREEIRSAYRALALKHHPDHGGSVERMREINLAYAAIVG
jgi:hypothetical protein